MEDPYKTIKWSVDEGIALVVINRPEALNALNSEVFTELGRIFTELEKNDKVRVVILTGEGEKAFAAGADIKEEQQCSVMEAREFAMLANRAQGKIEAFPKPVIAAVNGFALGGGCEVAMSCDIRIASSNAKFGQPEINLGIIPGGGGTQMLPRLIGEKKALELILTGDFISAEEALQLGLVNKVVPPENLMEAGEEMIAKLKAQSPVIIRFCKMAVNKSHELPLSEGIKAEQDIYALCFATEDQKEGAKAFLEKRTPNYKGK